MCIAIHVEENLSWPLDMPNELEPTLAYHGPTHGDGAEHVPIHVGRARSTLEKWKQTAAVEGEPVRRQSAGKVKQRERDVRCLDRIGDSLTSPGPAWRENTTTTAPRSSPTIHLKPQSWQSPT